MIHFRGLSRLVCGPLLTAAIGNEYGRYIIREGRKDGIQEFQFHFIQCIFTGFLLVPPALEEGGKEGGGEGRRKQG